MIRKWQSWVVLEYAVIALVYIITYYDKHIIHWIIAHFTLRNKDKGKENNVVLPWEASRSPCTLKSYLQCGMTVSTDAISVLLTEEHYTGSREEEKGKEGEITEHTVFFVAFGHASINMVRIFCRKRNFSKLAYSSCKYRRLASLEKSVIFFFPWRDIVLGAVESHREGLACRVRISELHKNKSFPFCFMWTGKGSWVVPTLNSKLSTHWIKD